MSRKMITRGEIQAHQNLANEQDVVWMPLYDFQAYGTQGGTLYTFFTSPIGQGTTSAPGASGAKGLADTNMRAAGQLGKGQAQFVTGVEAVLFPGAATTFGPGETGTEAICARFANDVYRIGKAGVLTLTIGSDRKYVEDGPLQNFPPVSRLAGFSALAIAATTTTLNQVAYASWAGEPYGIVPIYIDSNQNFQVSVAFPAAVAPASAIDARIGIRLRGYQIRNAQ